MRDWGRQHASYLPSRSDSWRRYAELFYNARQSSIERVARTIRRISQDGKIKEAADEWLAKTVGIGSGVDRKYLTKRILDTVDKSCTVPVRSQSFASERTFRRSLEYFGDSVRLMSCKGAFSTCHICTVAAELLRSREKRFTRLNRDIILKWRRLHLEQQAQERQHLNDLRADAARTHEGQPLIALIYPGAHYIKFIDLEIQLPLLCFSYAGSDGMTKETTKTPKEGSGSRRAGKFIEHRVIGVEVVCGPINGTFIYSTDNMVAGGANGMIEVIRQAKSDLADLLHAKGLKFPDKMAYQFDNCTENKNKTLFGYLALLVETGTFKEITANFLIVGHTHSSIDQYFSVLSRRIRACNFIGTPLSMRNLLQNAHADAGNRPLIYKDLQVCFFRVAE